MPRLSLIALALATGFCLPALSQEPAKARPNYELASRWTSAKVSKLVFDTTVIPGARHGFGAANDYFNWVRAEYFCKHLLGEANTSLDLMELAREQAQRGERRAQPEEGEQD
ncbi:MAG: hypothetical protein Q8O00_13555 [Holophaga sp.]|nr:hypothetical protein [Holophaga sp.]